MKNHGGLHNRISCRLPIRPFTLHEFELYANSLGLCTTYYDLLEYYMVLGGVAFYWTMLEKDKRVAQNIDNLIFSRMEKLHEEFNELFDSLFNNPQMYMHLIELLGKKRSGLTRNELIASLDSSSNGNLTRKLEDLQECGFVSITPAFNKKKKEAKYQLADNITIFYYKYIKENNSTDEHFCSNSYNSAVRLSWVGLAFERVCFQHVPQIKKELGISGVSTQIFAWRSENKDDLQAGAQIDMAICRADNVINICEMKYSESEYIISKEYDRQIRNKIECFMRETKTKKTPRLTMITANGLVHNEYWNRIQYKIPIETLFAP